MKPNRTSMLLRSIFRNLDIKYTVCPQGFPSGTSTDHPFPDPHRYSSAKKFAVDYLAYNLARKRELAKPTVTQMRNSLNKWAEAEHRCHIVNQCGRWVEPLNNVDRDRLDRLSQSVRSIISNVLMDEWPSLDFNPTGGSTATLTRKYAIPSSKVDGTPLTEELQPHKCAPASQAYLELMLEANPGIARRFARARDNIVIDDICCFNDNDTISSEEISELASWLCSNVPPAKFNYVPKDWKYIRLIAQSNSISIMVQKTFGDTIRRALLKVGVDLNDQKVNQEWAEIGSLTGLVATVDLSAASDSISLRMIDFLPQRWQDYCLASRDTHVSCGTSSHKLAMLAGMGNGYIFELESLLFYAMTRAVVEECKLDTSMISVYGDDIICPVGAVPLLEEFFLSLGFLLNSDKSFSSGPFRESCGKHFFKGVDVTPWYIKSDLDSPDELYHCYNGLSEWSNRIGYSLSSCLSEIVNCISPKDRHLVPITWSTKSGLHYPCDGIKLPYEKWNSRWQRYEVVWTVYSPKPHLDVSDMLPTSMAVTHSLMQLNTATETCDDTFYVRAFASLLRRDRSFRGKLHGNYYEPIDSRISWSMQPQYRWTKHRSVSFEGDA